MFKRFIRYNFSNRQFVRKWLGGYWEYWEIDILLGPIWMSVSKEQAYDKKYRPGCGRGTPYCEYYSLGYFGSKLDFTEEVKVRLERESKLKRLINE